jgi:anti-sigma28 factor (negative regulator of flagellin synthesis)
MTKAHISHVDLLEHRFQDAAQVANQPQTQEELSSVRPENVAHVEGKLMACCDEEVRAALVQTLKAQVDAGSYAIDSTILAQKMQDVFGVHPTSETGEEDLSSSS